MIAVLSAVVCRRSFERFARSLGKRRRPNWAWGEKDDGPDPEWAEGEAETGSWHKPWTVRHWNRRLAAAVISAMVESWAWPVIEEICGTADIAVLLGLCLARHAIDVDLGVGAHQDAKGLPPVVPFSVWVPMHYVTPGSNSGLGFVVRPPDSVLPTLPHGDVGPDYVLGNIDRVWVPTYRAGDLTIHTNLIPHFTTGYGHAVTKRLAAMGIRAHPMAARSPWQNGHAERLIGSIRRECLDHIVVFGDAHLRRILAAYTGYYNELRTHLSLDKDSPGHRPIQRLGQLAARPILGGLHHQYCRI